MNLGFSHEPAVWIGVAAAIIEAVLVSGLIAMPADVHSGLVTLVPIVAAALVRLFVTPNASVAAAVTAVAP